MAATGLIPDLLEVPVPVGGRALIVSELHLTGSANAASTLATTQVAQAIESWTGPGVLIFNGGGLELLTSRPVDGNAALAAYPRLVSAVKAFATRPGRRVLYLPGARDSRAAWDGDTATALRNGFGAEVALAAELRLDTGAGPRLVRVEPGHRFDPLTCPGDPRNPADSPLGHHLVCEVLPALRDDDSTQPVSDRGWLAGLEALDDPATFPRFLASRLAYRRLGRHAWWLLLPLLVAVLLRLPLAVVRRAHEHVASATRIGVYVGVATVVDLLLVALVATVVIRQTWRALAGVALSRAADRDDPNGAARGLARELVTSGHAGLITGHTRRPELTRLGSGFYANTGCVGEVVSETASRLASLGMPSLFLAHRQVAWVELEAGNDLHVRLLYGQEDLPGATWIERLLARPSPRPSAASGRERETAEVVAAFPQGASWPSPVDVAIRLRRVRRVSASLVAFAGIVSMVSAFSQPFRDRLEALLRFVPLAVPEAANTLVALASIGLLLLARSIRRGQRRAWLICEGLLVSTAFLHLVKGFDLEEALVAAGVALFLFINRSAFQADVDRPSANRGVWTLVGGAVAAVLAGAADVELGTRFSGSRHHQRLPLPKALLASAERLVGLRTVALPDKLDDFFAPAMIAVAVGLVLAATWLFFRPVAGRRMAIGVAGGSDAGLARARGIVERFGSGTLDYFALRSDKQFFFWRHTVVAHGVYGTVCLVSPDPIGPPAERDEAWQAFHRYADENAWTLGVLGAGEDWLPIYRASGLHDLYVGDEAVVDCRRFTLEGGHYKGLRQAVNRIAKYGYTISFHDPAHISPALRASLEAVMTKSRRGDVERGFSMTLGRAFDPQDEGLLLAVVHGPGDSGPVAFCQYVPAPGIDGYSLDLMRRDDGEHPNGLMDFAVVETIRRLQAEGRRGLGLNFATMRALLAGEAGEGLSQRIQAWLLRRMSDSMQIESLWKFNAKYDPEWQPRYALYDAPEHALPAAIAVARAESFWELPVIGRFLVPPPLPGSTAVGAAIGPAVGAAIGPAVGAAPDDRPVVPAGVGEG